MFVTGKPCKKCEGTKRYRSTRACVACARKNASYMRQKDPDRHVMHQIRCRTNWYLRRATPPWADKAAIRRIEEEAERLSGQMGIHMEVVHEVPIRGRTVCGLHIPENLRVVSRSWKNLRRFNTKRAAKEQMHWLAERGLSSTE